MSLDEVSNTLEQFFSRGQFTYEQLRQELETPTNEYFNQHHTPGEHNQFFVRFTPFWSVFIQDHKYFDAIKFWNFTISLALNWERQNGQNTIHKGTPLYFLGVSAILNNELENGFLVMHQAMAEDKRLCGRGRPEAPAFWFVSLEYTQQDQFFIAKVQQIATYLSDRLREYSNITGCSLTLDQLRARFLRHSRLKEEVFLFVYSLFRLRKLIEETSQNYKTNTFSSILHANLLFDLTVILDKVIEHKNPRRRTPNQKLYLADELIHISTSNRIPRRKLLSFNLNNKIGTLKGSFEGDFSGTLKLLLNRRYTASTLSEIECNFAIAYGIRNFGAHKIENQKILYKKMPQISQSILNSLFYVIENGYRYNCC